MFTQCQKSPKFGCVLLGFVSLFLNFVCSTDRMLNYRSNKLCATVLPTLDVPLTYEKYLLQLLFIKN